MWLLILMPNDFGDLLFSYDSGDVTQGLTHSRQALYRSSQAPRLLFSIVFLRQGLSNFSLAGLEYINCYFTSTS
jgi:hypothetical protein